MKAYFRTNKGVYSEQAQMLVILNKISKGQGAIFAKG